MRAYVRMHVRVYVRTYVRMYVLPLLHTAELLCVKAASLGVLNTRIGRMLNRIL